MVHGKLVSMLELSTVAKVTVSEASPRFRRGEVNKLVLGKKVNS